MLPILSAELTKTQIKIIAEDLINNISCNGSFINSIEIMAKMELLIKEIKANESFKDQALSEIEKYGKGLTTPSGTKIELSETGVKYHYENCNDEILTKLESEFAELEMKIDERKKFLKLLPSSGMDVITTDGELVKIYPPFKTSTSSFKTTIQK